MIKFFNKIRQQMLIENKMGRYFKYAIGEIILVMIGILLALQVNTWNNNRELKKEEFKIMKSLHKEFSTNLVKFDKKFQSHIIKKESIETVMSINPRAFSVDSLYSLVRHVNNTPTFDPFQGIYNSVISSGKIEIISIDTLKESVSGYQDLLRDYRESEDAVIRFLTQNLHNYMLSEGLLDNYQFFRNIAEISNEEEQRIKKKFIKFIESDQYENHLTMLRAWLESVFKKGNVFRQEIVSIISLLDVEIEKHEN
ncbi:DUF6090 family protein [Winogradskyella sp. PG-2]|uniref:DUF6090 family protein n=1 Tax=Winogradskyella sp. PG-2 TaxID=754409 RepID=UPI00045865F7|nr:DUF6090 family protein [Winogradskyella sp. PG-2]BAO75614.1 hypothetical protein WPG_1384 [Winogradskyella sp. PG-2]